MKNVGLKRKIQLEFTQVYYIPNKMQIQFEMAKKIVFYLVHQSVEAIKWNAESTSDLKFVKIIKKIGINKLTKERYFDKI